MSLPSMPVIRPIDTSAYTMQKGQIASSMVDKLFALGAGAWDQYKTLKDENEKKAAIWEAAREQTIGPDKQVDPAFKNQFTTKEKESFMKLPLKEAESAVAHFAKATESFYTLKANSPELFEIDPATKTTKLKVVAPHINKFFNADDWEKNTTAAATNVKGKVEKSKLAEGRKALGAIANAPKMTATQFLAAVEKNEVVNPVREGLSNEIELYAKYLNERERNQIDRNKAAAGAGTQPDKFITGETTPEKVESENQKYTLLLNGIKGKSLTQTDFQLMNELGINAPTDDAGWKDLEKSINDKVKFNDKMLSSFYGKLKKYPRATNEQLINFWRNAQSESWEGKEAGGGSDTNTVLPDERGNIFKPAGSTYPPLAPGFTPSPMDGQSSNESSTIMSKRGNPYTF